MTDWLRPLEPTPRRKPAKRAAESEDAAVSFERAVERFAEHYVSRKTGRPFSTSSRRNVLDNLLGSPLTSFRAQYGISSVADWNGDHAADYLRWLQLELRRDSATIKKVRGQLRSFGQFCEEEFHTAAGSGAIATLTVSAVTDFPREKDPALTHREADALLKAARSGRDRLAVAMLLYTGVRPSELLAIDTQHLRLERNPPIVEIRATVHDAGHRAIPLTIGQTLLPQLIRAHLADPKRPATAARLFLSLRSDHLGKYPPLTMEGLKTMLAHLGDATGIKCNPYRFRHTFCTWCADAGLSMLHLQQLLGHASSDMVAPYYRANTSQAMLEAARLRF